jgi:spore maturation protein CgeB
MKIVIFGLSISSAWGNGHATLLRGLCRELNNAGHEIEFFERDVPYYAAHRDAARFDFLNLHLYPDWDAALPTARQALRRADVVMVTSFCPDGASASFEALQSNTVRKIFYDMDTPVTLAALDRGEQVSYLPSTGLSEFDLVLSYTGGIATEQLKNRLGARWVETLYGWVDPAEYHRTPPCDRFAADLSYLGTYSPDRQDALDALMLQPARTLSEKRFLVAGALYPASVRWPANVRRLEHVTPPEHAAFYSSCPLTLSVTRGSMARMGFCPSGRLFEAAACGTAVLSDWWKGIDEFFIPGEEILIATSGEDTISALNSNRDELNNIGNRARERALSCHTAKIRAQRLISLIERTPENVCEDESRSLPCGA